MKGIGHMAAAPMGALPVPQLEPDSVEMILQHAIVKLSWLTTSSLSKSSKKTSLNLNMPAR